VRDARVVLVVALAAVLAWAIWDAERRGVAKGQAMAQAARVDTLWREVARTDTVWRDSVRVAVRWRDRWDSVRVTDTVTIDSIVYVPLAPADSTIRACFAAVRSCDPALAAKDTLITALRWQLDQQPKPPSALRVWAERALWLGAGVGVGALVGHR
jgi:hypothetical protein